MGKTVIMTDSTADLSKDLLEKYRIEVIPLCIVMDDKSYFDGKDITPEEIIAWSDEKKTTPKTAAAGIEETIEYLKPHKEAGDDVINMLEINTTPGMTQTSFIPQQVRSEGKEMKDVLNEIIADKLCN